jgi:CubicO group peptidase (beta-lactamase class C family)
MRLCLVAVLLGVLSPAAPVEERVRRVENGLVRAILVKGRPAQKYSIGERMKEYKVRGVSIAVVAGGELEWARGYGATSAEAGGPVGPGTLFQAASVSKPVAAMVALRLVELGKLSLDEDVNRKLRSWKVAENEFTSKEKVTLRRLLSHTAGLTVSGFPGYAAGSALPTLRQVLDGVKPANTAPVRPDIPPGSRLRYAGGGYEVMQQLVEDVTGRPFPEVAQELVLGPLGMSRSTYQQPLPAHFAAAAAVAHRSDGTVIQGRWHTYPEMAAAGLWTTSSDLARVILEIQKPRKVLKAGTVQQMLTAVLDNYGLGFGLRETGAARSFSHGGANAGYRCMLFAYRDSGSGAVVMTNSDNGNVITSEVLRSIASEYGWPDHRPQEKTLAAVSGEILSSYAGNYQFPGFVVTVTVRDGRLYAQTGQRGKAELLPESETAFFSPDGAIPPVRFQKKDGRVIEMTAGNLTGRRQ